MNRAVRAHRDEYDVEGLNWTVETLAFGNCTTASIVTCTPIVVGGLAPMRWRTRLPTPS